MPHITEPTPGSQPKTEAGSNPFISSLSLMKHDVPAAKIFEQLTGRRLEINPHTGISNAWQEKKS